MEDTQVVNRVAGQVVNHETIEETQVDVTVEVLIDYRAGNLSIIAVDDFTGMSVEHTLSLEAAWKLVTELNISLLGIGNLFPVVPKVKTEYQVYQSEPRIREAVMEAIGADSVRTQRYIRPTGVDGVKHSGLRTYILGEEPVPKQKKRKHVINGIETV